MGFRPDARRSCTTQLRVAGAGTRSLIDSDAMSSPIRILDVLADGRFHSGEELGAVLGVTRGAVWKHLRALRELDLEVFAVRGRGYRLAQPLELLQGDAILAELGAEARLLLDSLEVHPELDSTNRYLLDRAHGGRLPARACVAERQTAGRGRRGRSWVSPFGANLYLSLSWLYTGNVGAVAGLSLAAAVAVADALESCGLNGLGLKWPNDLFVDGCKLGGILLEMSGEAAGPCQVVIGVGINVAMPAAVSAQIGQSWVDLASLLDVPPSRNRLAGRVLESLILCAARYQRDGMKPFLSEWQQRDVIQGQAVDLHLADRIVNGTARGIDESGALLVETSSGLRRFASGEVSVRMAP